MKLKQQLEECTFKPKIIKNYSNAKLPSKTPTPAEGRSMNTLESEEGKNLPVYEKLNKFARDKDLKLRDYQEAQQWRELKDCTFRPQINQNKKSTFRSKRKSNSVIGIRGINNSQNL